MVRPPSPRVVPSPRSAGAAAPRPRRSPRAWRPGSIEALEGRALLAASLLDPGFNGGQPYVLEGVPYNPQSNAPHTTLNSASAVAVSPVNGDIIVAGTILYGGVGTPIGVGLAVRALSPAGVPIAGFGTNGQATVTLPTGAYNQIAAASDVLVQRDGKIIVAADLSEGTPPLNGNDLIYTPVETVVARLNADGTPDTSFGTNGLTIIGAGTAQLSQLALQADGKIVLGGTTGTSLQANVTAAATRLDADGSVDPSFNGGNLLTFAGKGAVIDVAVDASDRIDLTLTDASTSTYQVTRLNASGTTDASFGAAGVVATGLSTEGLSASGVATAIQPDGKIVIAGGSQYSSFKLIRLDADGSADPAFTVRTLPLLPVTAIALTGDGKIVVGLRGLGATRSNADGTPDLSFGPGAVASFSVGVPAGANGVGNTYDAGTGVSNGVAVLPDGRVVVAATAKYYGFVPNTGDGSFFYTSELIVAALRPKAPTAGDYDGDGKADVAAQLATLGYFAVRKSTGGDVLFPFGATTVGATIPVEADYDGDGFPDVAAYLPGSGTFVYAPSSAPGTQVSVPFGSAGAGNSIPAPGDYDGDGKVDFAVYLPAYGALAVDPSGGKAPYLVPFGSAGAGASIPAPGDYDGDGGTDVAVHLPAIGALAVHPSGGGLNYLVPFGSAGAGNSIPAPGDYNGDGKTDVAVYLPTFGEFAVAPSGGGAPYLVPFGAAGAGNSIPAPGDYDGDGKTDLAVYLPKLGLFAYRPSSGGPDVIQSFGAPGAGVTVPSTSIPYAQPSSVAAASVAGGNSSAGVWLPLTPDVLLDATGKPKKSST